MYKILYIQQNSYLILKIIYSVRCFFKTITSFCNHSGSVLLCINSCIVCHFTACVSSRAWAFQLIHWHIKTILTAWNFLALKVELLIIFIFFICIPSSSFNSLCKLCSKILFSKFHSTFPPGKDHSPGLKLSFFDLWASKNLLPFWTQAQTFIRKKYFSGLSILYFVLKYWLRSGISCFFLDTLFHKFARWSVVFAPNTLLIIFSS